jgi:hypothetical protein
MKQQMLDVAQKQVDGVTDAIKDEITGKAVDWLKENGGDEMERSLQKLERMKDKYEK